MTGFLAHGAFGEKVYLFYNTGWVEKVFEASEGYILASSQYTMVDYEQRLFSLHITFGGDPLDDQLMIVNYLGVPLKIFRFRELADYIKGRFSSKSEKAALEDDKFLRNYLFHGGNRALFTRRWWVLMLHGHSSYNPDDKTFKYLPGAIIGVPLSTSEKGFEILLSPYDETFKAWEKAAGLNERHLSCWRCHKPGYTYEPLCCDGGYWFEADEEPGAGFCDEERFYFFKGLHVDKQTFDVEKDEEKNEKKIEGLEVLWELSLEGLLNAPNGLESPSQGYQPPGIYYVKGPSFLVASSERVQCVDFHCDETYEIFSTDRVYLLTEVFDMLSARVYEVIHTPTFDTVLSPALGKHMYMANDEILVAQGAYENARTLYVWNVREKQPVLVFSELLGDFPFPSISFGATVSYIPTLLFLKRVVVVLAGMSGGKASFAVLPTGVNKQETMVVNSEPIGVIKLPWEAPLAFIGSAINGFLAVQPMSEGDRLYFCSFRVYEQEGSELRPFVQVIFDEKQGKNVFLFNSYLAVEK